MIIIGIVGGCLFLFLIYGYAMNFIFRVEEYEICNKKIKKDFRAVFLTDLHTVQFGSGNEKLLRKIREIEPDMIFVTGDMVVKSGKKTERVYSLMEQLVGICPVYYSPGNHEIRLKDYEAYKGKLQNKGVAYLENKAVVRSEYAIVICGLDLPEEYYHKCWKKVDFSARTLEEIFPYESPELFHVLLAHNPEYMEEYEKWGADLTLSGHLHGGIMILPGVGGVISPSLRLFPKYDQGYRKGNKMHSIISRGLGLHHIKLRFFNIPELAVINFTC